MKAEKRRLIPLAFGLHRVAIKLAERSNWVTAGRIRLFLNPQEKRTVVTRVGVATAQKFRAEAFPETWTIGIRTPNDGYYYGLSSDRYPDQWESTLVWNSLQSLQAPDGIKTGPSLPWNFLFPEVVRGVPKLRLVRKPRYAIGFCQPEPLLRLLANLVNGANEAIVCIEFRNGSDIYLELCDLRGHNSTVTIAPGKRLFWQFECQGKEVESLLKQMRLY